VTTDGHVGMATPLTPLAPLGQPGGSENSATGAGGAPRLGKAPASAKDRAATDQQAKEKLAAKSGAKAGATGTPAKKQGLNERFSVGRLVKIDVVMGFSRQLSSFLEAGIPIVSSLEIVSEETASEEMKKVIDEIRASILRGGSFADAIDAHPDVFPTYYRAMVRSAEFTGNLDGILTRLTGYLDRDITARKEVKSALTYPVFVLCLAFVAIIAMSVFVLPKFKAMYSSLGASLPLPTRMLLGFTDFITTKWPLILFGSLGTLVMVMLVLGGKGNKPRRDRFTRKLPVLGNLFGLIALERFCRVLAALVEAGVPLPAGIEVSAASTNNTFFEAKLAVVKETVVRGGGFSAPINESGVFPTAARQMIRVGEQTGSLGVQLSKAANYYERELSFAMKKATELFQPAVILFVGFFVGFIAVAQVAAMFSIFSQIR
jgi:type IV pilus assembly protein PilC